MESGAERENQTGGQRRRRLAEGGAHCGDAEKGSGLVEPVQTALNGVIKNGDYDKVLNRWGEGVERIPQSEVNPAGLGD